MNNQSANKKLLVKLLMVQIGFISFILGLFSFSMAMNKREMAQQITYQVQSQLKSAPSREIPETLLIAQTKNFSAVGYFDEYGNKIFSFPTSTDLSSFSKRSLYEKVLSAIIETNIYFDGKKKNIAGRLRFIYPRFSFIPYALGFWMISVLISIFLFRHYKKIWLLSLDRDETQKRNALISKIVNQVNHDLRSPIQTLFAVVDDSQELLGQDKKSIYSAIDRIQGITGDLKKFLKSEGNSFNQNGEITKECSPIVNFASSLKQLCEEKKMAFREKGISVEVRIDPQALSKAAFIVESEFLRVCSNLLGNSFEALESKFKKCSGGKIGGKIEVSLRLCNEKVLISFYDNGVGIPQECYSQLGQENFTFGKSSGTGLGLSYVFNKVYHWGGEVKFFSKRGGWTKFDLSIPFERELSTHKNKMNLNHFKEVLISNDHQSLYHRWSSKLQSLREKISSLSKTEQI